MRGKDCPPVDRGDCYEPLRQLGRLLLLLRFGPRWVVGRLIRGRHVYGTLHTMLREAVADELLRANPCVEARRTSWASLDKDPSWREGAISILDEAEQLI